MHLWGDKQRHTYTRVVSMDRHLHIFPFEKERNSENCHFYSIWCRERSSYLVPARTAAFQNTLIGIKYWISSPHLIHFTLIFDVNMFFSAAIQALMHLRFDECSSRTKIIEKKTAYSFSRAEAIKSPDVFKSFFFLFVFRWIQIRVDKLK